MKERGKWDIETKRWAKEAQSLGDERLKQKHGQREIERLNQRN